MELHISELSLSTDSENYATERYPSSLPPWSLQGRSDKDGVYNKTIGRIQPTKLDTLTGTFFLLEYDSSMVLTISSYLALTSLTAKAGRTIAWRVPLQQSLEQCLNTASTSPMELLQTQQRTTTTVWVSLPPLKCQDFLIRKWHQCPSLKYQSLPWYLIWLVSSPGGLNRILYFCNNKWCWIAVLSTDVADLHSDPEIMFFSPCSKTSVIFKQLLCCVPQVAALYFERNDSCIKCPYVLCLSKA